ncbi:hypothetical protein SAMN04487768_0312 [Burkholderia sp. b13]|nr:hypothetical protein SAMN04487768_0312 [Burkholderia sp. b13]
MFAVVPGAHPYHRADRIAKLDRIHLRAISGNHATGLEPADPLGYSRLAQMDAPSDLGMRNASVLLQQFKNPKIILIELDIHDAATQKKC